MFAVITSSHLFPSQAVQFKTHNPLHQEIPNVWSSCPCFFLFPESKHWLRFEVDCCRICAYVQAIDYTVIYMHSLIGFPLSDNLVSFKTLWLLAYYEYETAKFWSSKHKIVALHYWVSHKINQKKGLFLWVHFTWPASIFVKAFVIIPGFLFI